MISYYSTYQSTAKTDIQRLVEKLKALNSTKGEEWEKIMKYGDYVNTDMNVNVDVLPDGLPNDDSLCITVLGFALNDDGIMKDELVGRLQTALASAQKYPTLKPLAIVTSDYHVQRGCLLYYSQLLLSAYDAGDNLLDVISNAGYKAGYEGYESISLQAMGLK